MFRACGESCIDVGGEIAFSEDYRAVREVGYRSEVIGPTTATGATGLEFGLG
jgi:hypothetical protein